MSHMYVSVKTLKKIINVFCGIRTHEIAHWCLKPAP
jgi:hypothetical protein